MRRSEFGQNYAPHAHVISTKSVKPGTGAMTLTKAGVSHVVYPVTAQNQSEEFTGRVTLIR